ncbi:hypothetical protein [Aeromonas dhakensis]
MESATKLRLREQVSTVMRLHHYSNRTKSSADTETTISYASIHCDAH